MGILRQKDEPRILGGEDRLRLLGSQTNSQKFPKVIEGFERSNPLADYNGDTGSFNIQQTTVSEGSNALESTTSNFGRIVRTDDGSEEFGQGQELDIKLKLGASNAQARVRFGVVDISNHFAVLVDSGQVKIVRRVNGSFSNLARTTTTIPTSEFLRVVIRWQEDNVIETQVFDTNDTALLSPALSTTDSSFTAAGGIGFASNLSPIEAFDELRIVREL